MPYLKLIAGAAALAMVSACQMIPGDQSIADYCAIPDNADEGVCRLKVEVDGNTTAIADTDMRLSEARSLAASASDAAAAAQSSADAAMARAEEAMNKEEQVVCETRTIQKTDTGTCRPGYTLTSCTQTRYTTRAGGLSFLREINDEKCRFNSRVLEMQVRCCAAASSAPEPEDVTIEGTPVEEPVAPAAEPQAEESSPLSF